jgi:hypothetical protein
MLKRLITVSLISSALFASCNSGSTQTNAKLLSVTVDDARLAKAMGILEKTASSEDIDGEAAKSVFAEVDLKGTTVKEMLTEYSDRIFEGEGKVYMRLPADKFPEADDGSSVIGLVKNTDASNYAVDLYNNASVDVVEKKRKDALRALFEVTGSGALVGIQSSGWSVCGTQMVGMFIVHPVKKKLYLLVPENTDC